MSKGGKSQIGIFLNPAISMEILKAYFLKESLKYTAFIKIPATRRKYTFKLLISDQLSTKFNI